MVGTVAGFHHLVNDARLDEGRLVSSETWLCLMYGLLGNLSIAYNSINIRCDPAEMNQGHCEIEPCPHKEKLT